ncbi:protein kinase domain-containing protein [Ditylenchus destructor]|nr:protein kinase domain-containing protein [Ditylenchus destructor]
MTKFATFIIKFILATLCVCNWEINAATDPPNGTLAKPRRAVINSDDLKNYTGTRRRELEDDVIDDEPTALIQDPLREYTTNRRPQQTSPRTTANWTLQVPQVPQISLEKEFQNSGIWPPSSNCLPSKSTNGISPGSQMTPDDFMEVTTKRMDIAATVFGTIYRVYEKVPKENKAYSMKKMAYDNYKSKNEIAVINRLKEKQSSLEHVAEIIAFDKCPFEDSDHKKYLRVIMENFPGGTLAKALEQQKTFKEDLARSYAEQIVQAVEFLHKHGIIHRAIESENFMLDANGNLKLVNFGVAKLCDDPENCSSNAEFNLVRKGFVAPEALLGQNYGYPVDWWSVGNLIYEMIYGKPIIGEAFHDKLRDAVMRDPKLEALLKNKESFDRVVKITFAFLINIGASDLCKDIIKKLLTINPGERLGSNESVQEHPWFAQEREKEKKRRQRPGTKGDGTKTVDIDREFTGINNEQIANRTRDGQAAMRRKIRKGTMEFDK